METLSPALYRDLLNSIDRMQAFPASVQDILRLTRDSTRPPRELVEVIDRDPIITVKVLRVANSAYYSLPRQVTSIDHAVALLGYNTVKNLALSIALLSAVPPQGQSVLDSKRYLHHSLSAAAFARMLAARIPDGEPHDYFLAGLLHDFGKVVLAQVIPQDFQKAQDLGNAQSLSLHQALMQVTGIDHARIGSMLLEQWHFPPPLVAAIRQQYLPDASAPAMAVCVYAANQICKCAGMDCSGTDPASAFPPLVQQMLGGTLEQVMASLGDVGAVLQEARQFSEI